MKSLPFAAALGAAVLVALPALGTAATPAAENTIALEGYTISSSSSNNSIALPEQGNVRIAFRNDGSQPATGVVFDVVDGDGVTARIADVGTFDQGVTIQHQFNWVDAHQGESVKVAEVRYADGSVWSKAPRFPMTPREQAQ